MNVPLGYALHDSTDDQPGKVELSVREFTSSDDGDLFITRLEGFPATLLSKVAPRITPSQIDHLVAIISKDLSCKLYLNELRISTRVQPTRTVKAGELVHEDDIADIVELQLGDINVPNDAAIVILFSANWRKGLFFDFTPILPDGKPREYDLARTLGGFYAFLTNRSVFSLDEDQWKILLESDWFPFVSLPKSLLKIITNRAKKANTLDLIIPQVSASVRGAIPRMLERWNTLPEFASHFELIKHAASRFLENDFVQYHGHCLPSHRRNFASYIFKRSVCRQTQSIPTCR